MINEKQEEILKKAINTWGERAQILMVLEEMSELQKEILKYINRGQNNIDGIIEETADVEITLEQLKYIFNIHKQVEKCKDVKIEKIKSRLKD